MFEQIDSKVDLPKLEHEVLDFWKKTKASEERRRMNEGKPRWIFIDGPITGNNPMGVHNASTTWSRRCSSRRFIITS